jgi:hypothetical protein
MADILTVEQINEKAAELSTREGVKVTPMSFTDADGNQIVGYIKEPNREAKMVALNEVMKMDMADAGRTILDSSLLVADSDPRILSDDTMYLSACTACFKFVSILQNQMAAAVKKN